MLRRRRCFERSGRRCLARHPCRWTQDARAGDRTSAADRDGRKLFSRRAAIGWQRLGRPRLPPPGAAAYKGVLLSTNAQSGWKDARWLGGYLTNSALLIGCAELLVLSALTGQTRATAILRMAFIVLLVLNVIPLALLFRNLQPTHARLYAREQQWRVGALIFAAGTLTLWV